MGSSGDTSACCATWAKLFILAKAISDLEHSTSLCAILAGCWKHPSRNLFFITIIDLDYFKLLLKLCLSNQKRLYSQLSYYPLTFYVTNDKCLSGSREAFRVSLFLRNCFLSFTDYIDCD